MLMAVKWGGGGCPDSCGSGENGFDGQHSSSCYPRRPAATAAPILRSAFHIFCCHGMIGDSNYLPSRLLFSLLHRCILLSIWHPFAYDHKFSLFRLLSLLLLLLLSTSRSKT